MEPAMGSWAPWHVANVSSRYQDTSHKAGREGDEVSEGPIIGFRTWVLGFRDSTERSNPLGPLSVADVASLAGLVIDVPWNSGVNVARCRDGWFKGDSDSSKHPDAKVPAFQCRCGIYMLQDFEKATKMPGGKVLGVTQGWGKIIEHDDGWRCEKAQIVALLRYSNTESDPPLSDRAKRFSSTHQAFGGSGWIPPEIRGIDPNSRLRAHPVVVDRLAMLYDVRVVNYDYELIDLVEKMRKGRS